MFNFTVKEFILGNGTGTPTLQFYKRGFELNGGGASPSYQDIILSGNTALTLVNSKANGLNYVKLFGATEQRNLPSEFTQVEYIETTGTQYIDTGIIPTINSKAEVKFAPTVSNPVGYWGTRLDPFRFCCTTFSSGQYFSIGMTNGTWPANRTAIVLDKIYDCVVANGYASINGTEYIETQVTAFDTTSTFKLGYLSSTTGGNFRNAKYYICKLWDNDLLVFNGIPCRRNYDNVLGMYDTVTGNFLTNSGTDTFTAGADVVPSPDTPMDIWCNNGAVKAFKTLNISTYDVSASDAGIDITFDGTTDRRRWNTLNDDGTDTKHYENGFVSIYMNASGHTYFAKALVDGVAYNGSVYNTGEQIDSWDYAIAKNIDIYCPTINTDGTTETVEVTGKNLYDFVASENLANNGTVRLTKGDNEFVLTGSTTNANFSVMSFAKIADLEGKTITLSYDNPTNNGRIVFIYCNADGSNRVSTDKTFTVSTVQAGGRTNVALRVEAPTTDPTEIFRYTNIQIELGTTETDYEPYKVLGTATAEMLLSVGDYKDEQSVIDGGVIHRCGIKVLDGTETFDIYSTGNYEQNPYFITIFRDMKDIGSSATNIYSNCFRSMNIMYSTKGAIQQSKTKVFLQPSNGILTVDDFKAWLADQYANGMPIIIVYPLETPATETVTAQPLSIQAGTNIITAEGSIDNLGLEVSYKATV